MTGGNRHLSAFGVSQYGESWRSAGGGVAASSNLAK